MVSGRGGIFMYEGIISGLQLGRGFGFVATPNQPDVFFHMNDIIDLDWDERLRERRVRFEITQTPKGARAVNVRPAD